jgi:hypothetical protein
LRSLGAESDTHELELRRLMGGNVGIRIFEVDQRAGIAQPGATTLSDLTFAIVKGTELKITTLGGIYSLLREQDAVVVGHLALDTGIRQTWRARLVDVLLVLRQFGTWAA